MSGSKLPPPRAPPTPSPTPGLGHHDPQQQQRSKLPKFLQKSTTRDRSKSVIDPIMQHSGGSTSANVSGDGSVASSSSSSMSMGGETSSSYGVGAGARHRGDRKAGKLKGTLKELKDERIGQIAHAQASSAPVHSGRGDRDLFDESEGDMPVIIEPDNNSPAGSPTSVRSRIRSDRPLSASSSDSHPAVSYYPAHSSQRIPEPSMGSRLSGWFSHTFSTSSTDLSLPTILANTAPAMGTAKSKSGGGLGILTAARHGKGHLDKAVRYLLDSDATPDKSSDPIWILGVQHPGYEPPPPPPAEPPLPPSSGRRSSLDIRRSSSIRNSVSSLRGATSSPEPSMVHQQRNASAQWPPGFYSDFTSRVWLTYRTHYPPIRDQTLAQLEAEANGQIAPQPISASPRRWNILGGGEKGWTTDSGWGCMLRTGQSLLANALIHLHLGCDWRRPPHPVCTADYATYVKILTWFFDSTDSNCPFSVHRMALAGKDLGKDVGQWFGPSTAAGAIKTLVGAFAEAGLGVSVATDGVVYETDVLAASNAGPYIYRHSRIGTSSPTARRRRSAQQQQQQQQSLMSIWGQRPVLVLVGIRLGLDCVNPVYYDTVKALFTFPQSVGIAGGRPSSSYYFVGVQADNLFYLDPHHARPAVPFRPPPSNYDVNTFPRSYNSYSSSSPADSPPSSYREPFTIPGSSSNTSRHVKASSSASSYASPTRISPSTSQGSTSVSGQSIYGGLDPIQEHYVTAYSPMELRTFHCDRVRKMPLSSLDPSMLIGFLCRDERDWRDLRERVTEMTRKYKAIFAIQDEPPSWPSDSDEMGMESVSDVDIDMDEPADAFSLSPEPEGEDGEEVEASENVDAGRPTAREESRSRQSEEVTTEEDPLGPITPGPSAAAQGFKDQQTSKIDESVKSMQLEEDLLGDDEEWVDTEPEPGLPVPTPRPREAPNFPVLPVTVVDSTATTASYVSASSSVCSLEFPEDQVSGSRKGSPSGTNERERGGDRALRKDEKESKPRVSSKMRRSKSSGKHEASASQSQTQEKEFVPFPVVDDREPDDADFYKVPAHSQQSTSGGSGPQTGYGQRRGRRTGSTESQNRTPIASVVTQTDSRVGASRSSNRSGSSRTNNASTNGNGYGNGYASESDAVGGTGYRIRNVFARDGGRTQSGGVRGIIAADLDDASDS